MKTISTINGYNLLTVLLLLIFPELNAQDYLITFSGRGASTSVNSVKVDNLTQGTTITVTEGNSPRLLKVITGYESPEKTKTDRLIVYPNPMTDHSVV